MFEEVKNCSGCAVILPVNGESLQQFKSFSFCVFVVVTLLSVLLCAWREPSCSYVRHMGAHVCKNRTYEIY